MNELYVFLIKVLDKPGLFQVNRVEDINYIVLGYSNALIRLKNDMSIDEFFGGFNEYFSQKCELDSTINWCRAIRFYSGSDSHSLNIFKENLIEYYEKWRKS